MFNPLVQLIRPILDAKAKPTTTLYNPNYSLAVGTNVESYASGYTGNLTDFKGIVLNNQGSTSISNTVSSPGLTKSMYFNGSSQCYYSSSSIPELEFGYNPWTFECWFMTTNASVLSGIMSKRNPGGAANNTFAVELIGGSLYFTLSVSAAPTQINMGTITNNTWYHVACVVNGGYGYAYLNGVQVGQQAWTDSFTNTYPLVIGARASGFDFLRGYISSFAFFNTAKYTRGTNFTPPQNIFI